MCDPQPRCSWRASANPPSANPAATSTTFARDGASSRDFRTNPAHCACFVGSSAKAAVSPWATAAEIG